jgi:iron complex outermembrane receptor protein
LKVNKPGYHQQAQIFVLFDNQGEPAMRSVTLTLSSACFAVLAMSLSVVPARIAGAKAIEEVIVTARKREESLQDVPISVQAFTGEEIAEQGIVDLQMLAPYTPSFSYTPSPGASDLYFMRGLGTFGSGVHFEPGVGQVFNGYFSTRGRLGRSALIDVAQVEVLKGPQGSIIGKNTSLGAINITSNRPTEEFEGTAAAQYNFEASEGVEVDGVLSGPFSESVRGRVAVNWRDVDGWVFNSPTGQNLQQQEDLTARFMLDVDFTEGFSGEFMYQRTDYDRQGKARMPVGCQEFVPAAGPPHSVARTEGFGLNCTLTDSNATQDLRRDSAAGAVFNSGEPFTLENDLFGATLTWEHENFEIQSLSAFFSYEITDMFSGDQRDIERVSIQNAEEYDQFYQEFRLTSTTEGMVDYTAGLMYFDGEMEMTQTFHAVAGSVGGPTAPAAARHEFASSQTRSYAAFGQVDWHLDDTLTLTLGGRYTDEDRDGQKAQMPGDVYSTPSEADPALCFTGGPLRACTMGNDGMTPGGSITGSIGESNFSYNASLQWAANDSTNFYLTYATGFKSGGFDLRGAGDLSKFIFRPEESVNVEVGGKHMLADGSVRFNWALFHTTVDDLQAAANDPVLIQQIVAQGDATSQGVEVDFLWAVTDNFRLSFVSTWLNAEYDHFLSSCYLSQVEIGTGCMNVAVAAGNRTGVQQLAGRQMVFAPDWSHVAGAQYNLPLAGDKNLSFSAKWVSVGEHFTSIEMDPLGFQSGTDRIDVTVALSGEKWVVAVVGRNLGDELVHNFGSADTLSGGATYATNIEQTRAISLRFSRSW